MISPIFVLGPPRCGKSELANLLGAHPALRNVDESGVFDRLSGSCSDELGATDATPSMVTRAHLELSRLVGDARPIETTPSNSLRVEFISLAFPKARYLIIRRDTDEIVREMAIGRTRISSLYWRLGHALARLRRHELRISA